MTDYNIKRGDPTTIKTKHEFVAYKYHPYGLAEYRNKILNFIEEKQSKNLSYDGYDNLTNAWRTPWDMHSRYPELMDPISDFVTKTAKELSPIKPLFEWYHAESWIAKYGAMSGANLHSHGMIMGWSYCYYVKVPDEGPGIMLWDELGGKFIELNVSDGDIIFFRSFIKHQVLPCNSESGERIIVSGNVRQLDLGYKYIEQNYSEMNTEDWSNNNFLGLGKE